jgi:RNA polymerase sigma-70 factor (ECF subfamily)
VSSSAARSVLERIAHGEPDAVREGMDRFGGLVWSLARRLCPNPADAEDAVQEVFIDLWRHADRFDAAAGTEATFVATVARRRLIDRHRRGRREADVRPLADEAHLPPVHDDAGVEVRDAAARARKQMDRLRPDERRVLELSLVDGLSQTEVAEATDLPLGTVKTHARRGLARLRRLMGGRATDAHRNG